MSKFLKAMRLRRALLKIRPKPSAPPRLPLNKNSSLPTHSESTLPQPLIPRNFISFRCNVYKKAGEGAPCPRPKVLQHVTTCLLFLRARKKPRNPNPLYALLHNSRTPRGGGVGIGTAKLFSIARVSRDESWLSFLAASRGSRIPNHRPRNTHTATEHESRNAGHVPLVPRYRCAATRKVPESQVLVLVRRQETYPLPSVSNVLRADIGHGKPERRPGSKSIPGRRTGVARARRPGSNVLT